MKNQNVKRGALFFLLHPGEVQFSGYGLTVVEGSIDCLVGLLMVDRPQPVSQEWLDTVQATYGEYELHAITRTGDRGIVCQMFVEKECLIHVRPLQGPFTRGLQEALLPLLASPPNPKLKVRWDGTLRAWRSRLVEQTEDEQIDAGQRRAPLFALGQVVATPGALDALKKAGQIPQEFLHRHVAGDWGQLDEHDQLANERAVLEGQRILSAYTTKRGERLWVITEWNRETTTLLRPSEY